MKKKQKNLTGPTISTLQKIIDQMKKNISSDQPVIVAVSGGPDSIFLLHLLIKKITKNIIVAHINHKLRGRESDKDESFVENLCKKNNLIYHSKTLPQKNKGNLEEYARDFRYQYLNDLKKKYNASHILTAHHQGDNIETLIMNLARGSFLRGLKGMEQMSGKNNELFRPLLTLSKTEILKFLKKHKIPYRMDKSNFDTKYSRNFIRHKIIPLFEQLNPNFAKTTEKNMKLLGELDNTLNFLVQDWIENNMQDNQIPISKLQKLPSLLLETILTQLYQRIYGKSNTLSQEHLFQLKEIIQKALTSKKKEFGKNYFLKITKNQKGEKNMMLERK